MFVNLWAARLSGSTLITSLTRMLSNALLRSTEHKKADLSKMSCNENLTAVLYGINDIQLEERPIPTPKDDEVLLKMGSVGICGSDVHYLTQGRIGDFIVEKPMVIGHEASGTVVSTGKYVKHLQKGDRVAIEPGFGCRKCNYCKEGRYNLCLDMIFCATPPIDGNLARYYVHPADFCYKLPDHVSLDEGALLEPLSVAVHGCRRGNVKVGSKVLILGAGPIGLVTLLSAKAFGASKTVITDITPKRLEMAKKLGADHTILVTKESTDEELIENITQAFGCQPDISMDCSGAEQSVRTAIKATQSGGTALLIGMGSPEMQLPLTNALIREVDIKGVFRYANCYPTALDLVATGKVNVRPLITHHYRIEETEEAFQTAMTPEMNPIKVMIHADAGWKA